MNDLKRLKELLKTPEGRKQLHSEIGDYKHFISIDDIHKISPALLNWIEGYK